MDVETETRDALIAHAETEGPLDWGSVDASTERVVQMLTLVVAAREFQFA
jgi:hypothetical protein